MLFLESSSFPNVHYMVNVHVYKYLSNEDFIESNNESKNPRFLSLKISINLKITRYKRVKIMNILSRNFYLRCILSLIMYICDLIYRWCARQGCNK